MIANVASPNPNSSTLCLPIQRWVFHENMLKGEILPDTLLLDDKFLMDYMR
jgi:hypothetical protein